LKLEKEPTIFELNKNDEELLISEKFINLSDPLSIYLKDIGQVNLLTREEEIELAKTIQLARDSKDETVIQLGRIARDRFIIANLRLVISIAKKYSYSNVPLMDLIQDGTLGLMKAVDRYQVEKGFKFSTYASWWIRQSITRSIANISKTIRIPVHMYDLFSRVKKATRDYLNNHGIEPNIETISDITGVPMASLKLIYLYNDDILSLDEKFGDGDSTYNDIIQDIRNLNPDEHNQTKILEEFIIEILQVLNERERLVIKMRYGIDTDEKTLEEIGSLLGVSRERVRQLEKRAIKKLKDQMLILNNN
jgi:RNA polymerase primary sigma factor